MDGEKPTKAKTRMEVIALTIAAIGALGAAGAVYYQREQSMTQMEQLHLQRLQADREAQKVKADTASSNVKGELVVAAPKATKCELPGHQCLEVGFICDSTGTCQRNYAEPRYTQMEQQQLSALRQMFGIDSAPRGAALIGLRSLTGDDFNQQRVARLIEAKVKTHFQGLGQSTFELPRKAVNSKAFAQALDGEVASLIRKGLLENAHSLVLGQVRHDCKPAASTPSVSVCNIVVSLRQYDRNGIQIASVEASERGASSQADDAIAVATDALSVQFEKLKR